MKQLVLILVIVLAVLSVGVLFADALATALRKVAKRARNRGAVGAVIDREGRALGVYLDPFGHPWRAARMHGPESPWSPPAAYGESAFAWEGFGETEEEALEAANRLRRRHLQLFSLLNDEDGGMGVGLDGVPVFPPDGSQGAA